MKDSKSNKPVFLYIVIAVLVLALAALGVLTFASLDRLASLQAKVTQMSETVEEISESASTLIQQSMQLEELKKEEASMPDTSSNEADSSQTEGTLSLQTAQPSRETLTRAWTSFLVRLNSFFPKTTEPGPFMYVIL